MGQGLYESGIGNHQAAVASFEAAHRITQQSDIVLPIAGAWLGAAYVQAGRPADALALLLEAERKGSYRSGGIYNWIHHYKALAQAQLAAGDLEEAYAAIGRAEELATRASELGHLAAALRIRGDIEAADPAAGPATAADSYRRALEIARARGMRPLVARCLTELALSCTAAGDATAAAQHAEEARRLMIELGLATPDSPVRAAE